MARHFDHAGRALSLLIFIAGIGLLGVVFTVAYHMLTNPVPGLATALAAKSAANPQQPLMGISSAVIAFLLRLAVLFVMTLAASLIAARGIHLYFAAIGASPGPESHASVPVDQSATAPAVSARGSRPVANGPRSSEEASAKEAPPEPPQ